MTVKRPTPADIKDAEAALTARIAQTMVERHGPGMKVIVGEVMELLWPCLLMQLREELDGIGGLDGWAAAAKSEKDGDLRKAKNRDRRKDQRAYARLSKVRSVGEAGLALPGIGRLDLSVGRRDQDHANPHEASHFLRLRLSTRAVTELRESLQAYAEERQDLFYAGDTE